MCSKKFIVVLFGLAMFLQGCHTLSGAQKGLKEDWKVLLKTDDWVQENLW